LRTVEIKTAGLLVSFFRGWDGATHFRFDTPMPFRSMRCIKKMTERKLRSNGILGR
jgi:hypothetical protein